VTADVGRRGVLLSGENWSGQGSSALPALSSLIRKPFVGERSDGRIDGREYPVINSTQSSGTVCLF